MVGTGRPGWWGLHADNAEPPPPPGPTDAPPGSVRKLAVMVLRAELGLAIHHPLDAGGGAGWAGEVCLDDLRGNRGAYRRGGHYRGAE